MGLHGLLRGWLNFLYVNDARTSQKTPYSSTACYGDSFTFLYVDDVRTSQEIYLWASTACYGNNFTLYSYIMLYFTVNTPMSPHGLSEG
jgi:hypothetical protein